MKVRHQGMVLLGAPLVCQLFFAILLIDNFSRLDNAATKEAHAKQIIAACEKIRFSVTRVILTTTGDNSTMVDGETVQSALDDIIKVKFGKLRDLVKGDRRSEELAGRFQQDLKDLANVIGDVGELVEGSELQNWNERKQLLLTRYLDNQERTEAVRLSLQNLITDEHGLLSLYEPVVKEFEPRALLERKHLRTNVLVAFVAEGIIGLLLAVFLGQRFLKRLVVLMNNIERFSAGETRLQSLQGDDELAELDGKFREMAKTRFEAEELKQSLMAMVAHDLRSPLGSANLMISIILERNGDELNEWTQVRLRRLDSEIFRLFRLANTLLDIEQIESNKFSLNLEECSLSELIDSSMGSLAGMSAAKNVPIEIDSDQVVALNCDKERVIQILVNLLSNAIKFSPQGSPVKLATRLCENRVRFEVIDSGPGVPEETRSLLFQKFSQLNQDQALKKTGSGIGLYVSKVIVSAHGGTLGYEAPEKGGSCFWFELPLSIVDENPESSL